MSKISPPEGGVALALLSSSGNILGTHPLEQGYELTAVSPREMEGAILIKSKKGSQASDPTKATCVNLDGTERWSRTLAPRESLEVVASNRLALAQQVGDQVQISILDAATGLPLFRLTNRKGSLLGIQIVSVDHGSRLLVRSNDTDWAIYSMSPPRDPQKPVRATRVLRFTEWNRATLEVSIDQQSLVFTDAHNHVTQVFDTRGNPLTRAMPQLLPISGVARRHRFALESPAHEVQILQTNGQPVGRPIPPPPLFPRLHQTQWISPELFAVTFTSVPRVPADNPVTRTLWVRGSDGTVVSENAPGLRFYAEGATPCAALFLPDGTSFFPLETTTGTTLFHVDRNGQELSRIDVPEPPINLSAFPDGRVLVEMPSSLRILEPKRTPPALAEPIVIPKGN